MWNNYVGVSRLFHSKMTFSIDMKHSNAFDGNESFSFDLLSRPLIASIQTIIIGDQLQ